MAIIKIDDKEYNFKYKIEDIKLIDYLDVIDILNEDEYEYFIDKQGKKRKRKEPIDKKNRSEEFLHQLNLKIIQRLSNNTIALKYLKEAELFDKLLSMVTKCFENIHQSLVEYPSDLSTDVIIKSNDANFHFTHPKNWTFYKWVGFDTISKGEREKDNDNQIVVKVKGDRYILPLFADINGNFDESFGHLEKSYDFLLNHLNITHSLSLHLICLNLVNNVKEQHPYIYGSGGGTSKMNIQKHNEIFGWMDTLRGLADKGVFGTYTNLKKSNLFEVLEYLNCSISYDLAEYEDSKIKTI